MINVRESNKTKKVQKKIKRNENKQKKNVSIKSRKKNDTTK